jgi:hypothetical protein
MKTFLHPKWLIILIVSGILSTGFIAEEELWGFFGHRKINRYAVYCLPEGMLPLFKQNIEYISEHAVDPDKRRYATKFEAVRHYIDIDHWGENPFEIVPRDYIEAVAKFGAYYLIKTGDTTVLHFSDAEETKSYQNRVAFIRNNWLKQRYEDVQVYECDSIVKYFDLSVQDCSHFYFKDVFSDYGIVPYELLRYQYRLRDAFFAKDVNLIIRTATDMGHYIADAHVPLHTTENYNGQMTNQNGIHAFWESRIPELYADTDFDFLVGQAQYIEDPKNYFWEVVEKSHRYVGEVLDFEKELSETFSRDQQYCYEERLNTTVRIECEEYARAYHTKLDGMVEERMRESIKAVADCWYTAWVDAGQPIFENVGIVTAMDEKLEQAFKAGNIFGRKH